MKSLKQNSYPRGLKPLRNEYRSNRYRNRTSRSEKPYNQMNKTNAEIKAPELVAVFFRTQEVILTTIYYPFAKPHGV